MSRGAGLAPLLTLSFRSFPFRLVALLRTAVETESGLRDGISDGDERRTALRQSRGKHTPS